MRTSHKFSTGISAENFVRDTVLKPAGLKLRKLRTKYKRRTPEGYVFDRNDKKIALIEIKCVSGNVLEETNQYILDQIKKTIAKFKMPGGGYFSIRRKCTILKKDWPTLQKLLKQKLYEYIQKNQPSKKIVADGLEIVFIPVKRRRIWRWGSGHGPITMGTDSKRIKERLSHAKKQLKQQKSDSPKIVILVIDSGDTHAYGVRMGIIGNEVLCFPLGIKAKPSLTHEGYQDPNKNRFKDGFLSGVIAIIPHWIDGLELNYRLWIYENGYCSVGIPNELRSLKGVEVSENIGPRGIIKK